MQAWSSRFLTNSPGTALAPRCAISSAAAAELRISQPAISRHIAELGGALGLGLVERARRGALLFFDSSSGRLRGIKSALEKSSSFSFRACLPLEFRILTDVLL